MKNNKMWWLVVALLLYLLFFSVACLNIFITVGAEPSTLIERTFTVIGLELVVLMVKKLMDNHRGGNNDE